MYKYNRAKRLVVYGEWAPKGKKHHLLNGIIGKWEKGIVQVGHGTIGDSIYSGSSQTIEAWGLLLEKDKLEMFTSEWRQQTVRLHEIWETLDQIMEPDLIRFKTDWWPKKADPIVGENGYEQANFYVSSSLNPQLKNLFDTPHPDIEDDIIKLWRQQLSGEKKYETCRFISLIKDSSFDECNDMFKNLPKVEPFLAKLKTFYEDMAYEDGYLLKKEGDQMFGYVIPKSENQISHSEVEVLVKNDISQKATLLKNKRNLKGSKFLNGIMFKIEENPDDNLKNAWPGDYMETINDILSSSIRNNNKQDWFYDVNEACYGIAANFTITNYLMSGYSRLKYDFDIPYLIWKGGWEYKIIDNTCYILRK
ncbi:hypothetical protein [Flammeovirga sp. SJP92]|uniref:hypothetical protein n=1 Tax=Flammeovirga sp. SJP92 TaxID=1775430 RepID=UPI000787F57D|nr:hypothetical protein [Flammeovirga sp. SJP92]KXX71078.1 hypothetical protein AVL50_10780 [Flammeovirga sp. SJP92]